MNKLHKKIHAYTTNLYVIRIYFAIHESLKLEKLIQNRKPVTSQYYVTHLLLVICLNVCVTTDNVTSHCPVFFYEHKLIFSKFFLFELEKLFV